MSYAVDIIVDWFDIDPMQARIEGQEIGTLISDFGGDPSNPAVIEKAIYNSLGRRYPWKNIEKKNEIVGNKKLTQAAYNRYIDQKK